MNVLYLKYAIEVARVGSINKAAENLYIAQPNLSRAIKDLENSIGITIFERNSKGMSITEEGKLFLQQGEKIIQQIDKVEAMFSGEKQNKQTFSISVPRVSYISHAFAIFSKRLDKDCSQEIFYKETNALDSITGVLRGEFNLGIIRYACNYDKLFKQMLEDKGLTYEVIADFKYVLIMSKNNPLAALDVINMADLKNYVEVSFNDSYIPYTPLADTRLANSVNSVEKKIFIYERGSQFDLLSANSDTYIWGSSLPTDVLDRFGLVEKSCTDIVKKYRDVIIYKKDYQFSNIDKMFITDLCDSKRKYIHD